MPWRRAPQALSLAALLALPALVAGARRPDLDVSIPPGAATDWGRAFPAFTPSRGSLFATSPRPEAGGADAPDRSSSRPRKAELDVHIGSSFGLVRILTWDLQGHLSWISGQHDLEPLSGRTGREPDLPRPGDALYWIGIAPLLRLMLHPELVSEAGTLAHLIEIGEPVLGVLSSVEREGQLRDAARLLEEEILARRGSVAPLAGETPLDRMWSRFVFEELVRAPPYDPQDDFGAQLFVFGEELLPYVLRYTSSDDPFLRRNAVAALSRYRQRDAYVALVEHALTGEDPVVLARALAGLGRGFGPAVGSALAERLDPRDEPWLQVAMIAALGATAFVHYIGWMVWMEVLFFRSDVDVPVLAILFPITFAELVLEISREGAWSIGSSGGAVTGIFLWLIWFMPTI